MAKTLYIEIGTEEIPAGYILPALESMSLRMARFLDENRIAHGEPTVTGTPRRLVLNVPGVADSQQTSEDRGHRAAQKRRIRCSRKAHEGCRRLCKRSGRKHRGPHNKADAQG